MTKEQHRRVTQALIDTKRDLNREITRYSAQHRENDLIAFYHQHIAKLTQILKDYNEAAA